VNGYRLESRDSVLDSGKNHCFRHHVQTGSGVHPASHSIVRAQGVIFKEIKRQELTADTHLCPKAAVKYFHGIGSVFYVAVWVDVVFLIGIIIDITFHIIIGVRPTDNTFHQLR
jgi:hypothetical protein